MEHAARDGLQRPCRRDLARGRAADGWICGTTCRNAETSCFARTSAAGSGSTMGPWVKVAGDAGARLDPAGVLRLLARRAAPREERLAKIVAMCRMLIMRCPSVRRTRLVAPPSPGKRGPRVSRALAREVHWQSESGEPDSSRQRSSPNDPSEVALRGGRRVHELLELLERRRAAHRHHSPGRLLRRLRLLRKGPTTRCRSTNSQAFDYAIPDPSHAYLAVAAAMDFGGVASVEIVGTFQATCLETVGERFVIYPISEDISQTGTQGGTVGSTVSNGAYTYWEIDFTNAANQYCRAVDVIAVGRPRPSPGRRSRPTTTGTVVLEPHVARLLQRLHLQSELLVSNGRKSGRPTRAGARQAASVRGPLLRGALAEGARAPALERAAAGLRTCRVPTDASLGRGDAGAGDRPRGPGARRSPLGVTPSTRAARARACGKKAPGGGRSAPP